VHEHSSALALSPPVFVWTAASHFVTSEHTTKPLAAAEVVPRNDATSLEHTQTLDLDLDKLYHRIHRRRMRRLSNLWHNNAVTPCLGQRNDIESLASW